jgi:hypothetical protein
LGVEFDVGELSFAPEVFVAEKPFQRHTGFRWHRWCICWRVKFISHESRAPSIFHMYLDAPVRSTIRPLPPLSTYRYSSIVNCGKLTPIPAETIKQATILWSQATVLSWQPQCSNPPDCRCADFCSSVEGGSSQALEAWGIPATIFSLKTKEKRGIAERLFTVYVSSADAEDAETVLGWPSTTNAVGF